MKKPLPMSAELKSKKLKASRILEKAFKEVRDLGLIAVSTDVTFNERLGAASITTITEEEWKHGVWLMW